MLIRELTWRGWSVRVRVPSRPANRLRRIARRPTQDDAPATHVSRDPQRALDFLRDPGLAGDGTAPSPKFLAYLASATKKRAQARTTQEQVDAVAWYHTIELPGGILTHGSHDNRPIVAEIGLPEDLRGVRALDVATYNGFWAFELERRGAEVVAVDLPTVGGLDLPPPARAIVHAEQLDVAFGVGFEVAAAALGSKVRREACSVYDLNPARLGAFDLVFVGDLLLHLERPLEALRRVRSVTSDSGRLIVADRFDPRLDDLPGAVVVYEGGWQGLLWWVPSLRALVQMIHDAGFDEIEVKGTYQLGNRFSNGEAWHRAVIHAGAGGHWWTDPAFASK